MWVRLDLRRRVRSLLVLALLVAVTTAVVLTAVAGSRRGASAVDRLVERDEAGDHRGAPERAGLRLGGHRSHRRRRGRRPVPGVAPTSSTACRTRPANFPYDAAVMHTIEAPVVLEGRLADPARDDEVGDHPRVRGQLREGRRRRRDDPPLLAGADRRRRHGRRRPERARGLGDRGADRRRGPLAVVQRLRRLGRRHRRALGRASSRSTARSSSGRRSSAYINALVRLEGGGDAVPAFREELAEVTRPTRHRVLRPRR